MMCRISFATFLGLQMMKACMHSMHCILCMVQTKFSFNIFFLNVQKRHTVLNSRLLNSRLDRMRCVQCTLSLCESISFIIKLHLDENDDEVISSCFFLISKIFSSKKFVRVVIFLT